MGLFGFLRVHSCLSGTEGSQSCSLKVLVFCSIQGIVTTEVASTVLYAVSNEIMQMIFHKELVDGDTSLRFVFIHS